MHKCKVQHPLFCCKTAKNMKVYLGKSLPSAFSSRAVAKCNSPFFRGYLTIKGGQLDAEAVIWLSWHTKVRRSAKSRLKNAHKN